MRITFYILFFALFTSCVKDKPNEQLQPEVSLGNGAKVYIINEGNYGSNNASVSLYEAESGNVIQDIYKTQNNNTALGDVCQSMIKINNHYYIVVNNSGKITVVSPDNFKHQLTITGFNSPRYILPVSPNKAYVSDLYANSISILDLNSNTKSGSIPLNGWTEQMLLLYNKAFVTNLKSDYLYVINTITDQISDSILVGPNAGSIVLDKNSKVWVLSGGNSSTSTLAKLTRINPVNLQIETAFTFNASDKQGNLCINSTRDIVYFLNTHVYKMGISDTNLPTSSLISGSGHTFYGLAVNVNNNDIYVSDAIDYIQKSTIMVYSSAGSQKTTFKAGINASGFYFE